LLDGSHTPLDQAVDYRIPIAELRDEVSHLGRSSDRFDPLPTSPLTPRAAENPISLGQSRQLPGDANHPASSHGRLLPGRLGDYADAATSLETADHGPPCALPPLSPEPAYRARTGGFRQPVDDDALEIGEL